jgi:oxygen-independent coproporphyrinogen-3 oxidase
MFRVSQFSVPHISVYLLEGVKNSSVSEELVQQQYYHFKQSLEGSGYLHYEISNYARENYQCLHNLKYWQDKEYMGLGISASGYLEQLDYKNVSTLDQYRELLGRGQFPTGEQNRYSRDVRSIITGLRLIGGIPEQLLNSYPEAKRLLMSQNYLKTAAGRVFIPPGKLLLMNEILGYFI